MRYSWLDLILYCLAFLLLVPIVMWIGQSVLDAAK